MQMIYIHYYFVCSDFSILHDVAQSRSQSKVQMLKFLTEHPCCHALLLVESSSATPLELAKRIQVK